MKAEKSPPVHITEAFFIPAFSFSGKHRLEFRARGITEKIVAKLEGVLTELRAFYESGQVQVPDLKGQRETLHSLQEAFRACASRLEKTDKLTLSVLNAEALPKTGVSVLDLWRLIIKYGEAAQKTANGTPVKSGPDARKDTHVAVVVGETLGNFGIPLDDKPSGKFVISTGIVFEAMDIHKSDVRNAARRALKIIAKS